MLLLELAEFDLEGHLAMVFFLPENVFDNLILVRRADGECAVAALPIEVRYTVVLRPDGGTLLDFFDGLGEFQVLRKDEQDVDVIGDATDLDGRAFDSPDT